MTTEETTVALRAVDPDTGEVSETGPVPISSLDRVTHALQLPLFEGKSFAVGKVALSGSFPLMLSVVGDREVHDAMTLGKPVRITIEVGGQVAVVDGVVDKSEHDISGKENAIGTRIKINPTDEYIEGLS